MNTPLLGERSDNIGNSSVDTKKYQEGVNKLVLDTTYTPNQLLKRLIFFKAKMNISQFAKSIGVSRQCIFGLIAGTHRASPNLAKRISDALGEEDTRIIFRDGSIKYPEVKL